MALQSSQSNGVPDPVGAHTPNVAEYMTICWAARTTLKLTGKRQRNCFKPYPTPAWPRGIIGNFSAGRYAFSPKTRAFANSLTSAQACLLKAMSTALPSSV